MVVSFVGRQNVRKMAWPHLRKPNLSGVAMLESVQCCFIFSRHFSLNYNATLITSSLEKMWTNVRKIKNEQIHMISQIWFSKAILA